MTFKVAQGFLLLLTIMTNKHKEDTVKASTKNTVRPNCAAAVEYVPWYTNVWRLSGNSSTDCKKIKKIFSFNYMSSFAKNIKV